MKTISMGSIAKATAITLLVVSNAYFAATATKAQSDLSNLQVSFGAARSRMVELERSLDQLFAYSEVLSQMTRGVPLSMRNHEQVGLQSFNGKTVMMPPIHGNELAFNPAHLAIGIDALSEDAPKTSGDFFMASQATFEKLLLLKEKTDTVTQKVKGLLTLVKVKREYFSSVPTIQPAEGQITSQFGWRLSPFDGRRVLHAGIDVAAEVGSVIRAAADGAITFAGNFDDLGKTVVIGHGFGIQTRYGHTDRFLVSKGQKVRRGQPIALVGMTGNTTGPHLHYEVWVHDIAVDPMEFLIDLGPHEYPEMNVAREAVRPVSIQQHGSSPAQGG